MSNFLRGFVAAIALTCAGTEASLAAFDLLTVEQQARGDAVIVALVDTTVRVDEALRPLAEIERDATAAALSKARLDPSVLAQLDQVAQEVRGIGEGLTALDTKGTGNALSFLREDMIDKVEAVAVAVESRRRGLERLTKKRVRARDRDEAARFDTDPLRLAAELRLLPFKAQGAIMNSGHPAYALLGVATVDARFWGDFHYAAGRLASKDAASLGYDVDAMQGRLDGMAGSLRNARRDMDKQHRVVAAFEEEPALADYVAAERRATEAAERLYAASEAVRAFDEAMLGRLHASLGAEETNALIGEAHAAALGLHDAWDQAFADLAAAIMDVRLAAAKAKREHYDRMLGG